MRIRTAIATIFMFSGLLLPIVAGATGNINSINKHAWSENSGWSNLAPTGGGVTMYPDHLEGFAWAENFGWIKMGNHTGGGLYTYANNSNIDWGVNLSGTGLAGYAWSENGGWINFAPTGGGVTLNSVSGELDGYAWAENLGWIHFKGAAPAYSVKLNAVTLTLVLAGNGSGSIHSTPSGISCDASGGCGSTFFQYWPVTLGATPDWKSFFKDYSGDSTGATFTMDTAKVVTATFDPNYKARLAPSNAPFASIQDAYDNAADVDEIDAQSYYFREPNGVLFGEKTAKTITLNGGYKLDDDSYTTITGMTEVQGPIIVQSGKLIVERLVIK